MSGDKESVSTVVFSSQGKSARDAFTSWLDMASESVYAISATGYRQIGRFRASASFHTLGAMEIYTDLRTQDFEYKVCHYGAEVARSASDCLFIMYNHTGVIPRIRYNGWENRVVPGDWMVQVSGDKGDCAFSPGSMGFSCVRLPLVHAGLVQADLGALRGKRMGSERLSHRLVSGYLHALVTGSSACDRLSADALTNNLMELILIALRSEQGAVVESGDGLLSGMLLAVTQYIDAHFTDPSLSPASVAAHFGISVRYVHYLFSQRERTFSDYLIEKRLRLACSMLTNPIYRDRNILYIAMECGFTNLTHFGRRFRKMYGRTARELRAEVLSRAGGR